MTWPRIVNTNRAAQAAHEAITEAVGAEIRRINVRLEADCLTAMGQQEYDYLDRLIVAHMPDDEPRVASMIDLDRWHEMGFQDA